MKNANTNNISNDNDEIAKYHLQSKCCNVSHAINVFIIDPITQKFNCFKKYLVDADFEKHSEYNLKATDVLFILRQIFVLIYIYTLI